jgi:cytoskeleton protein RodZ
MSSVGAYLRGLRERQGLSVDELSRATRVLHHYLEALESDNLSALPAPVFARGFIRAYCQAVGADPEEALRLYDRSAGRLPERPKIPIAAAPVVVRTPEPDHPLLVTQVVAPQGEQRESRSRGTLLISFILLVILGAAFFAFNLTIQPSRDGDSESTARAPLPPPPPATELPAAPPASAAPPVERVAPSPPAAPQPAKPSASSSVAARVPVPSTPPASTVPASSAAPAAVSVAGATPTASAATAAAGTTTSGLAAPYRLIARTTETTWMRVRTEDGRTSEETIPANESREWISNGPFIITIGNAGGVSLELNGRAIPRLGASGAVITRLVLPSDNQ